MFTGIVEETGGELHTTSSQRLFVQSDLAVTDII